MFGRCVQIGPKPGEMHSPTRGRTDQAGAAHVHLANRGRHLRDRPHFFNHELMWQAALINKLDHALLAAFRPDGPVMLALDVHESFYNWLLRISRDPQVVTL